MTNGNGYIWPLDTDALKELRIIDTKLDVGWDLIDEVDLLSNYITDNCSIEDFKSYIEMIGKVEKDADVS